MTDILSFGMGMLLGWWMFSQPAHVIQNFKNPTCIKADVGRDKIKKCYELVEVKSEPK